MSIRFNQRTFALADVNSMYASCEQVFRPDLKDKPIVVLSNNDGCVIAQNQLAKDMLGMHMAQPWFELEKVATKMGVVVFSSNYELYANMSNRFMQTLQQFSPRVEVYSIDESFLDITGMKCNLNDYGQLIKHTVKQWTGLPICVGFGHSKTLAKLANHCAKKQSHWQGVCDLTAIDDIQLNAILEKLPVSKVWGIGSKLEAKLNRLGVENVLRLKRADPKRIRDAFGVLLERTIKELNGEVWLEFDEVPVDAKQVMSSRSFGTRVSELEDLSEAISYHAGNAAQRLRKQGLFANAVHVFIQNSPFDQAQFYANSVSVALPSPTDCTLQITRAALWLLKKIHKPDIFYQKAGVMLMDLVPEAAQQQDLYGYSANDLKSASLMSTMDHINKKYAKGTIKLASEGTNKIWSMRRSFKSPNYTNDWRELPVLK